MAILLMPPVLLSLALGQLEWLAVAALLVPPSVGLLLVLVKPQVGIGLVAYWTIQAWQAKHWRGVVGLWGLTVVVGLVSLLICGPWWTDWGTMAGRGTLWPWGIPIGAALLGVGLLESRPLWALAASPFLAPYARLYSFVGLALLPRRVWAQGMVFAGLWAVVGWTLFRG